MIMNCKKKEKNNIKFSIDVNEVKLRFDWIRKSNIFSSLKISSGDKLKSTSVSGLYKIIIKLLDYNKLVN